MIIGKLSLYHVHAYIYFLKKILFTNSPLSWLQFGIVAGAYTLFLKYTLLSKKCPRVLIMHIPSILD